MKIETIQALAEILSSYGLTAIEVIEGETSIRIEKEASVQPAPSQAQMQAAGAASSAASVLTTGIEINAQSVDYNRLIEVKSPLVGVFYSAPSPDSDTFVSIGSQVRKGDVLCIIETMKLMNEITAEDDGEIVDICIKNGDIAEFGQVLFKMF